jgi:hypothetical protein
VVSGLADALSGRFLQTTDNLELLLASAAEIERETLLCAFEGQEQSNPTQLWPPCEPMRIAQESNGTRALLWCSPSKNFLHFFSTAHPTCRILSSAN